MSMRIAIENLLRSAVVTMTPEAEDDQGPEFLYDGPGKEGAIFADLTADPKVTISLGVPVQFGDGFQAGVNPGDVLATDSGALSISPQDPPVLWTMTTNTPEDGTYLGAIQEDDIGFFSDDHDGNGWVLAIGSGTSGGTAKLVLAAKAGSSYRIEGWAANGSGAGNAAAIRLRDTIRNLYLGTDGEWHAGAQDLVLDSTAAHVWLGIGAGAGVEFDVPAADVLGAAEASLELQLVNQDAGFAFFDGLVLSRVLAADLMMVAGNHNIPLTAAPVWETSSDGVSWSTAATFVPAKGQFWALLESPVSAAYHRFRVPGTPLFPYFMGDLILAATQVIPNGPEDPITITYAEKGQARQESPGGTEWVENRGPYPPRTVAFGMSFRSAAETQAAIAILVDQLRGGAYECVVFPETVQLPWLAIYGRIPTPIEFRLSPRTGDLPEGDGQEHYARVSLTFIEGAGFEAD